MSRPLRIQYPDACYHILNRGAAKQLIFHNDNHYRTFLRLLNDLHKRFRVKIHAYCLMPNHYHLLLQTPLANLSCAMRHLDSLYTRRYNLSQKKDGPLLRGRFKSILVENENYLLRLSRYIHLNPTTANMVKNAQDYLWSSYRSYLNNKIKPDWLLTEKILSSFGSNKKTYEYSQFVAQGIDEEMGSFYKKLHLKPVLGSKEFIKTIFEKYLKGKKISPEIAQQKELIPIFSVELIKHTVAKCYKVDITSLKIVKRKAGNKPRQIAIYLACKLSGQKYLNIANTFTNITSAGVAKTFQRINKEIAVNGILNKELSSLEKALMSFVKT